MTIEDRVSALEAAFSQLRPKPVGRPRTHDHGTAANYFRRACRCTDCKAAGSAYFKARREKAKLATATPHN